MGLNWLPSTQGSTADEALRQVRRALPAKASLGADEEGFAEVARRVRAEYMEMPGLSLTRDQAQCLWGIDAPLCDRLLDHLVASGFLARTSHATYVRIGR
jgi:hypothetical protein